MQEKTTYHTDATYETNNIVDIMYDRLQLLTALNLSGCHGFFSEILRRFPAVLNFQPYRSVVYQYVRLQCAADVV